MGVECNPELTTILVLLEMCPLTAPPLIEALFWLSREILPELDVERMYSLLIGKIPYLCYLEKVKEMS